ncbi:MAG: DUF1499 domain-containing protein [Hyphococcus sp.]
MKAIIWLISMLALALAVMIAIAGPGARLGFWDYSDGFSLMRSAANPIGLVDGGLALSPIFVAAGLALLGAIAAFIARAPGLGVFAILCAAFAAGAGMVPVKMRALVEANPFIHEITTDFADPPPIIAAADLPRKNPPEYRGDDLVRNTDITVAQAQQQAFPEIAPARMPGTVDENAEIIVQILQSMGMEILNSGPTTDGWLVEATETSFWFGFIDDFVVRLRQEGAMTRVDVRSKSRVGGSDLGANARRAKAFFDKLDAATQ